MTNPLFITHNLFTITEDDLSVEDLAEVMTHAGCAVRVQDICDFDQSVDWSVIDDPSEYLYTVKDAQRLVDAWLAA